MKVGITRIRLCAYATVNFALLWSQPAYSGVLCGMYLYSSRWFRVCLVRTHRDSDELYAQSHSLKPFIPCSGFAIIVFSVSVCHCRWRRRRRLLFRSTRTHTHTRRQHINPMWSETIFVHVEFALLFSFSFVQYYNHLFVFFFSQHMAEQSLCDWTFNKNGFVSVWMREP